MSKALLPSRGRRPPPLPPSPRWGCTYPLRFWRRTVQCTPSAPRPAASTTRAPSAPPCIAARTLTLDPYPVTYTVNTRRARESITYLLHLYLVERVVFVSRRNAGVVRCLDYTVPPVLKRVGQGDH